MRSNTRALDLPETEAPHPGVSSGGVEVEGAVFVRGLPETEAPHLGVSSGGVEVEGAFAKFPGKHLGIEQPAA